MMSFPSNHSTKAILDDNMSKRLKPALEKLGFKAYGDQHTAGFSEQYWRDLPERIDVVYVQWDKHGRPQFVINFRPIDDPEDLRVCRGNREEMWHWGFGFTAFPTRNTLKWFRIGLLDRIMNVHHAARRVVDLAVARVNEIDRFLKGGPASQYLFEDTTWSLLGVHEAGRKPPHRRIAS